MAAEPAPANYALAWTCLGCGLHWTIEMPGFPGTTAAGGHWHTVDGKNWETPEGRCYGPIVAVMEASFNA